MGHIPQVNKDILIRQNIPKVEVTTQEPGAKGQPVFKQDLYFIAQAWDQTANQGT